MKTRVAVDQIVADAITNENLRKIAAAARNVIWEILFSDDAVAPAESQKKQVIC